MKKINWRKPATVKPSTFACEFREIIKTVKLNGAKFSTISTLIGRLACCAAMVWFEFAKIKGAK